MFFYDLDKFNPPAWSATFLWDRLEHSLNDWEQRHGLQLSPDFQRAFVWTKKQQTSFIECVLSVSGLSGTDIYFNHPGWMTSFKGDFVLVDGKQRIKAVLDFLNNRVKVFGRYRRDYKGPIPFEARFTFHVHNLPTKADVLRWYLAMNGGGTPHAPSDLRRVRYLLRKELSK